MGEDVDGLGCVESEDLEDLSVDDAADLFGADMHGACIGPCFLNRPGAGGPAVLWDPSSAIESSLATFTLSTQYLLTLVLLYLPKFT